MVGSVLIEKYVYYAKGDVIFQLENGFKNISYPLEMNFVEFKC